MVASGGREGFGGIAKQIQSDMIFFPNGFCTMENIKSPADARTHHAIDSTSNTERASTHALHRASTYALIISPQVMSSGFCFAGSNAFNTFMSESS